MSLNASLVGKVSAHHVELAQEEVWIRKKAFERAKSAYRAVGRKLMFWTVASYLRKLATWADGKPAAILIVGAVCLGLSAPVMILCSSSIGIIFLGMAAAFLIGASSSVPLLYRPDDICLQEKLIQLLEERLAREASHLLERAENRYFELRQVLECEMNRLLRIEWRLLHGPEFEKFLSAVFRELGYGVQRIGGAGDQGVDLILTDGLVRIAVQAKGYSGLVANSAVQQVFAGSKVHGCQRFIVVTNSVFTPGAREAAEATRCTLIDGDQIEDLIRGRIL